MSCVPSVVPARDPARVPACSTRLRRARAAGLLLAAAGLAAPGCSIAPPPVDAAQLVAEAIPAAGAIALRTEGAPLDEAPAPVNHLGLAAAIERALLGDPALQAALARVQAARTEAAEAGLAPAPVLDVVLRFPEGGGPLLADIGLGADVIALLRTPQRAAVAHDRLRAEAARALGTALDLLQEVQQRYVSVQAQEALRAVLDERRATLGRLLELAQARLEVGEATRNEAMAFEVERLSLDAELAELLIGLRQERLALARLVGEPSGAAAWTLDDPRARAPAPGPDSTWIAAALERRPEVQLAAWELAARTGETALAAGAAWQPATLGLAAEKDGDWSAGPGLSLPLPLGGRTGVRVAGARARELEALHLLTEARRRAVEDVRAALGVLQLSADSVERLRSELLPLQERRRTELQRAFDAREVDATQLLFFDQSLQESRTRLLELELQVALATIRLERAVGGPAAYETTRASATRGDAR